VEARNLSACQAAPGPRLALTGHRAAWTIITFAMSVDYRPLTPDDLEQAEWIAAWVLGNYEEPGLGPDVVRGMRDRRRRLVPAQPAGAPGRGWWGRRSAS